MSITLPQAQRPLFERLVGMTVETKKLAQDGDGCGTGVVLTTDGLIVGAYHVITRSRVIRVRLLHLDKKRWHIWAYGKYTADVLFRDRKADIFVAKLRKPPPDLVAADLVADDPAVGEALFRVGRDPIPLGEGYLYDYGTDNRLKQFEVSMVAAPGSSGGPIFTKDGALAGICLKYQSDDKLPPTAYCLPASVLRSRILRRKEVRDALTPEDAARLLGT